MELLIFLVLHYISKLILANQTDRYDQPGCLYGWNLNKDKTTCSIDCYSDEYTKVNVYCTLEVLKQLNINRNSSTLFTMPSGKLISTKAMFPSCYNVTSNSNGSRNVTVNQFGLSSGERSAGTFCYPISPQLLQCNHEVVKYGNYHLINSTLLLVPSLNIQAGLGDFYINENNGSAVVCRKNAKFHNIPRCNYITLNFNDIIIHSDGSIVVTLNNFTIKNPIYSVVTSDGKVQVCFPMSPDVGNCNQKLTENRQYYFTVTPDLEAYAMEIDHYFKPDQYYITTEGNMLYCANTVNVTTLTYQKLFRVYGILAIVAGILLALTILTGFKFFLQNNHSKCLLCHIVAFNFTFFSFGVKKAFSTSIVLCYVLFSIDYYAMMTTYVWLCIISFDSWNHFSQMQTIGNNYRLSSSSVNYIGQNFAITLMVGWGIPAIFLITVLSVDLTSSPINLKNIFRPNIIPGCFFNQIKTFAVYYYLPESVFTVTAITFVILTIKNIVRAGNGTELVNQRKNKQLFLVSIRMIIVMVFCWLVNLVVYFVIILKPSLMSLWFVTTGTTIVQGYALAIMYFPWQNISSVVNLLKQKNILYKVKITN
ncbi:hypothetical protein CHUAL_008398 [Chamberlinius hualienensis]